MHSSLSSDDMCTKSVVRFRFSLKDNCETLETLDLNLSDSSIETQSKYLSTICSIRSTIGVKPNNQLNTENLNMNKGLQNGHQLNDKSFIDHNLDINSITTTTSSSSTSSVVSTCIDNIGTSCEPTMGLSNATSKDSLTQHLLLNSLKSGKPENGQRIDLSSISWTDLKHNSNKAMDSATHSPQIETISESQTLDNNCLAQNSPLTDQTVDQMIEEVLNKSDSQVREELTSQSILENNTNDEQQPQHQCSSGHPIDHLNGTKSDGLLECGPNLDTVVGLEAIDATEEHMSLVRQTERLMRRIRRLQFRQTHKHLTQQMKAFVKNQQNVLSIGCQRQPEPNTPSVTQLQSHSNPVEDRMKLLTPEGVKGLSTSALVNLVKRLGSTTTPNNESNHLRDYYAQQTPNRPQLQTPSITSSPQSSTLLPQVTQTPTTGSQLSQQVSNSSEKSSLVKLLQKSQSQSSSQPQQHTRVNTEDKDAILNTIDTLSTNLRHFESRFDSDATDSSSGGESCDELEDYSEDSVPQHSTPIQQTTGHLFPMRKRSCWKWCVERAAIASRWTWLQAQVADLEFRIRQQNEMYRQLRATKGSISFGTSDHNLMVPTPVVCKPNTLSTSVTTNGQPLQTQSQVTGDVSAPPQQPPPTHADSDSHYCMRTLPMNSMRKRKLVHSMSALSGATRKAAKYSTIQCSCNGLPDMMWPCVLCNGRYSYVHVIDTDSMPHFERVALLDSACHPVLSLNNGNYRSLILCLILCLN
ncbi:unnamed protein product [Medioppia subpectinata]|uniref:KAT8 regulatory NSL complex subunit 1 n=1 Tax=Medioppia subpectinata TaxID=1979941 RepID=A0A7R9L2W7_9ACAR|nr:unnamed protein product [Medioppia subpectinata]CAG2114403.1 unnamed protein product [Medioppia subpectinata]